MNDAKLFLDAGKLNEAVEAALNLVKTNPTNATARTFLFELSCFSGDWKRAAKQLEVIGHQDANAMIGSLIFQQNFKAEEDRMKLFSDGLRPESILRFPKYVEELLAAVSLVREEKFGEARLALDAVDEDRPAFPCTIDGVHYDDLRDHNDLTMCIFEVLIKDTYTWLPFEHVRSIKFLERKSLRDAFWAQAEVETINGTMGEMFFPTLYVNSWKNADDQIRLGRAVDWQDAGGDIYVGQGARLYAFGGNSRSLLDISTIEFDPLGDDEE